MSVKVEPSHGDALRMEALLDRIDLSFEFCRSASCSDLQKMPKRNNTGRGHEMHDGFGDGVDDLSWML